ncbi:MAG TPA: maleylpyruvate isomerase N-terminal domain-containing protein [Actinopolymorphaceae bacterium]
MSDVTMTAQDYPVSAIPWPQAVDWSHRELQRYLDAAADPDIQALATRCPPWSVADLSAHLAATFRRFADQLEKARSGSSPPPSLRMSSPGRTFAPSATSTVIRLASWPRRRVVSSARWTRSTR